MDESTMNKFQHQFWVTKQTVFRKLGKKEDEHIVASDSSLDAKLELFKSIRQSSSTMNKLLDRYQERICYLAQEQNAMGRFLKEHGKVDKSGAGKMMTQMGKSLIYCSQQEIALRPSLLRLYQEVETFRNRAIEDTLETVKHMERVRTEYRATLNWMKNVSQELDPDTYKQMEKFRKVQTHVKRSKAQFDKLKLACLQKVDLLAAARCNMFSHALIQYQISSNRTTENIARVFNMLATSFKGYQHYEFSVIKDLAEPSKQLARECGGYITENQELTDELLFDIGAESQKQKNKTEDLQSDEDLLAIGDSSDEGTKSRSTHQSKVNTLEGDLLNSKNASELLENLLGPLDLSPDTEAAQEALDLTLAWPSSSSEKSKDNAAQSGSSLIGTFRSKSNSVKEKESDSSLNDLLSNDLDGWENDEGNDTMALLNELLNTSNTILTPQPAAASINTFTDNNATAGVSKLSQSGVLSPSNVNSKPKSFLPSQLLDLANLDSTGSDDLLNFNAISLQPVPVSSSSATSTNAASAKKLDQNAAKSWYDIFADLDPISNPDAVGKKESEEVPSRYC